MSQTRKLASPENVALLFFISGFAALIYQIVWQRVLFTTFGIDIESVTVIVSIFMFGLGVGSLAGGWLAQRFPTRLIECFIALETGIGLFGLISIPLIKQAGMFAPSSVPLLAATTYALLALPTMMMGATLPLLVSYLEKHMGNLGATVGKLYAYNTFGSAFAAFATVTVAFALMGQQAAVILAFCCNILTALLAWRLKHGLKMSAPEIVSAPRSVGRLSLRATILISAAIGYISLSMEIFWFRTLGFMTGGKAQLFGIMLAVFLCGIASGSLKVKAISHAGGDLPKFIRHSLLKLLVVAYISLPLVVAISGFSKPGGIFAAILTVGALAYFSGGIFPALCEIGIAPRSGRASGTLVSWVYFSNIVGATLGTLITGFLLFDILTLQQNAILLCTVTALLLAVLWKPVKPLLLATLVVVAFYIHPALHPDLYRKLQSVTKGGDIIRVVENRSGIITIEDGHDGGDLIYGGGVYDGRFNIDPVNDTNGIARIYMIANLHKKPERVLDIGTSGAAAARVLTLYQPVKELISIEINRGYLDVIQDYPEITKGLTHPKTQMIIDDGRRWLNHHPDEKFDLIVMNTSYYWRSNASNLLSRDFFEICKSHLNPGGILYFNTTGARDSLYTLAHVFKHVSMIDNFAIGSDEPIGLSYADRKKNLQQFIDENGKAIFASKEASEVMEKMAKAPLPDMRDEILAENGLWLTTDDNMALEYKKGSFAKPN